VGALTTRLHNDFWSLAACGGTAYHNLLFLVRRTPQSPPNTDNILNPVCPCGTISVETGNVQEFLKKRWGGFRSKFGEYKSIVGTSRGGYEIRVPYSAFHEVYHLLGKNSVPNRKGRSGPHQARHAGTCTELSVRNGGHYCFSHFQLISHC
jgi:hypothetical protein